MGLSLAADRVRSDGATGSLRVITCESRWAHSITSYCHQFRFRRKLGISHESFFGPLFNSDVGDVRCGFCGGAVAENGLRVNA